MGFDTVQFVEPPISFVFCGICKDVFKDCYKTPCAHRFCSDCLTGCLLVSDQCPYCRSEIDPALCTKDITVNEMISSLVVFCKNKDKKCHWEGQLCDLDIHLNKCPVDLIKCPVPGCSKMVKKCKLDEHLTQDAPFHTKLLCQKIQILNQKIKFLESCCLQDEDSDEGIEEVDDEIVFSNPIPKSKKSIIRKIVL